MPLFSRARCCTHAPPPAHPSFAPASLAQLLTYYTQELIAQGVTEYGVDDILADIPKWLCWPMLMDVACANNLRLFCEEYKRKKAAGEEIEEGDERRFEMNDRHRQRLFSALQDFKVQDFLAGLNTDLKVPFMGCCCYWALR